MEAEGPRLEALLHRLANCPPEFLALPGAAPPDGVDIVAIVYDHLRAADPSQVPEEHPAAARAIGGFPTARQRLVAVVCWLLHDDWFLARPTLARGTWKVISSPEVAHLAKLVKPEKVVEDPDRREELVRLCLGILGLRPQGETQAQAADRLTTLDSVERNRILRATAAAERRAREIREAMVKAAAQDAASRYGE